MVKRFRVVRGTNERKFKKKKKNPSGSLETGGNRGFFLETERDVFSRLAKVAFT